MNPLDEEQERKRREEIAAMAENEPMGRGAVEPSFFESIGQGISNRFNAAVDKAGQTLMNPGQAIQQKMMNEQSQKKQEDLTNTEVQTNTTTTYGDGSKEHTVKTQVPAGQPQPQPQQQQQAPMGPTMGPVAPNTPEAQQQAQQQAQAFAQQFARFQQPQAQARSMAQPAPQAQPRPQFNAPRLQSGQGPTQIPQGFQANYVPAQAGQIASAPGASLAQTAAQLQPTPYTPTAERMMDPMTQENLQHQAVVDARNMEDAEKRRQQYAKLLTDPNTSEGNKALANRFIAEDYIKEQKIAEANKKIAEATPNDLSRYMKDQNKEGSYVKAILLQRLGLQTLAEKEMERIEPTITMGTATDLEGNRYSVGRDKFGNIRQAFDRSGKQVGQETVAKLAASAMPTQAHQMPSVHGGLLQKTIMGPDNKPRIVTGMIVRDPLNPNGVSFEANVDGRTQKFDTTGLTTPSQNIEQKFLGAQADKAGANVAEGFDQGPLQSFPGVGAGGGAGGGIAGVQGNAEQVAKSLGIPIISGNRDNAAQKALYDASVAAGTPGRLPNGNPVAKPGTSKHETGNAIDVDNAKLTPAQRTQLTNNGFFQPLPKQDPNHWEFDPNKAVQGTPVFQQKQNADINKKKRESDINVSEAGKTERVKENAKTIDAKLDQLTSTQTAADRGIQNLQSNNHLFGGGTNQIEYFRQANIPLVERTAKFNNTQAILKLAATDNLETLSKYIKPLSNSDLAYIEKYNINERSSPAEVERWLNSYYRAASVAYQRQADLYNNPQAPAGKAPPPLSQSNTTAPAATGPVRKYNPTTGRLE